MRYCDLRDPYSKRYWPFRRERDPARTPMQWDGSSRAGFTTGQPWLPVSQYTSTIHVGQEARNALSLLTLHRWLIRLRQATASLVHGTYKPLGSTNPHCRFFSGKTRGMPHRNRTSSSMSTFLHTDRAVQCRELTVRERCWSPRMSRSEIDGLGGLVGVTCNRTKQ